jgi:hypothetical protein
MLIPSRLANPIPSKSKQLGSGTFPTVAVNVALPVVNVMSKAPPSVEKATFLLKESVPDKGPIELSRS